MKLASLFRRTESDDSVGPEQRHRALFLAAIVGWSVAAILCVIPLHDTAQDDFFITYRYALNLVDGHGFVFNPGERVFGTTEPGLGLLLALLHLVVRMPVHWLGTCVTGVALVAIGALLVLDARSSSVDSTPEILLAGTLIVTSPFLWTMRGAAAPLALLCLLAGAHLSAERPGRAGLLGGAAVWCRPDALVGAGALVLVSWLEDRRPPWRLIAATSAVILLGVVLATVYFGSPLPHTLSAKQAAAGTQSLAGGEAFWPTQLGYVHRFYGSSWQFWMAGALLGVWPLYRYSGRAGRVLTLFGCAIAIAYPMLEVPPFPWYIIPTVIAGTYAFVFLIGAMTRLLARAVESRLLAIAAIGSIGMLVVCPLVFKYYQHATERYYLRWSDGRTIPAHLDGYKKAALWLRDHSDPDATVGHFEIGVLGYFSGRHVDDFLGLVTPRSTEYVERNDPTGAFLSSAPDYATFFAGGGRSYRGITSSQWFRSGYRQAARLPVRRGERTIIVFQRRHERRLPEPRGR